jgi:hypothetical protein
MKFRHLITGPWPADTGNTLQLDNTGHASDICDTMRDWARAMGNSDEGDGSVMAASFGGWHTEKEPIKQPEIVQCAAHLSQIPCSRLKNCISEPVIAKCCRRSLLQSRMSIEVAHVYRFHASCQLQHCSAMSVPAGWSVTAIALCPIKRHSCAHDTWVSAGSLCTS